MFNSIRKIEKGEIKIVDPSIRNMVKVWWAVEYMQNTRGYEYIIDANKYNGIVIRRIK